MHQDPTPTQTIRDRQQTAVAALADLLTRDLPPLHWHVQPYGSTEHLEGQALGDDAEVLRLMRAWALTLGAEITRATCEYHVAHQVTAEHMGARIRIYGHTAVTYRVATVAKEASR